MWARSSERDKEKGTQGVKMVRTALTHPNGTHGSHPPVGVVCTPSVVSAQCTASHKIIRMAPCTENVREREKRRSKGRIGETKREVGG